MVYQMRTMREINERVDTRCRWYTYLGDTEPGPWWEELRETRVE